MTDPTGGTARISLGYGRASVDLEYDPDRFDVLRPAAAEDPELDDAELRRRIDDPIGSPPLGEILSPGDRVVVVVPDATRASGSARVAPALVEILGRIGLAEARIEFLIGAGTHRTPTREEITRILGPEVARRFKVHHHDAFDAGAHVLAGRTKRGTPVEINRLLVETDRVIVTGAIAFHYFAGFSGGRKGILPACASDAAIQKNHLLGFDRETLWKAPGVAPASLDGNPVSEDMEDAARLVRPAYLVNTVLDGRNRITALYAGDWLAAHRRGCAEYLAAHSAEAPERRDIVIVSCGGAPRDVNLIQSHKALEHARLALNDGGDLVLLAECTEGLGRADFMRWFVPGGSAATAAQLVERYMINGQTAWGIRWKSERYRLRLVSALSPEDVSRMGVIPHRSLAEALAACGPGRGYIIPNGLGTLPVVHGSRQERAAASA